MKLSDYHKRPLVGFDVETMNRGPDGIGPDPYYMENRLVLEGFKREEDSWSDKQVRHWHYGPSYSGDEAAQVQHSALHLASETNTGRVVCTHNGKFDFGWLQRHGHLISPTMEVWDTQIADYILSAQMNKFSSLDDCAKRYLGEDAGKVNEVSAMFKAGIGADGIEKDLLIEYWKNDIDLTIKVARKQIEMAHKYGLLPLCVSMMRAMVTAARVEGNGIRYDVEKAKTLLEAKRKKLVELNKEIHDNLYEFNVEFSNLGHKSMPDFDCNAAGNMRALFFGGEYKWETREENGIVKTTGATRYKINKYSVALSPLTYPYLKKTPGGKPQLDDEFLSNLQTDGAKSAAMREAATLLLEYRGERKLADTYLQSLIDRCEAYGSDIIHPTYNMCLTQTGRLSSSDPNMQNIPSGDSTEIKELFLPLKDGDWFIEFDFKQLEVIGLAFRSKDAQLIHDVSNGVDIHKETGKLVFGPGMSDGQRRIVKTINFGLIYGGKAGTLAAQAGVTKSVAQQCIDAFYSRYPGVKTYHKEYYEEVSTKGKSRYIKREGAKPDEYKIMKCDTGRMLAYKVYESTYKRGEYKVSPTETANYPIQSLATGDIVPTMMWVLDRALEEEFKGKVRIVNQVHDSLLLNGDRPINIREVGKFAKGILERAPEIISAIFNVDFNLPLKVDAKCGTTWGKMHKLEI